MRATCPDCGAQAHLSAFFVEDDGKRLAALLADMPPELGRAVISYLGLFKPAKTALRMARAVKITQDLVALVAVGTVCKDERSGVHRPATALTWTAGIETMLTQRASLSLPLENHNYLRAVAYGLADKADAVAERQREADAREGKHLTPRVQKAAPSNESKLQNQLTWIEQQVGFGMEPAEAARLRAEARKKYGPPDA
ncbi:hypothetical protein [Pseudoxanthomonas sp. UTMC 1351]|uniref:hypothetical protein n=1 Tax=Pseudoxanthomonas sp. UTMC 1351 TaxID=2695853 RepID=UPI0034CD1BD7